MAAETLTSNAADAHAGTTEVAHESGGGGLPQFRFEYWGGQIVWLLFIFLVLYILLSRVFVPRLRRILDSRAQTIADAVEQARKVQAEAEAQAKAAQAEIDEARTRARGLAAEAKAKAAAELAKSQAAEDERLKAQMDEAEARIRSLRDTAMANVETIATETAQAIVEKLTGEKTTAKDIAAALSQGAA
ncbi:hypothetical protein [Phenylobacterium sp.]|uniref:F0F1 ATP synthase subunit B family protein n=1 Tax=Phenylobacterium sp. TaxID=1871053 RepID=UPI0035AFA9C1